MTVKLQIQLLHPSAAPPAYMTEGAAGMDLTAAEPVTLAPGARALVPTGLEVAQGQIRICARGEADP